jgi:hypothetical protein
VERLEVTTDGHVRNTQVAGEVRDAHATVFADPFQDHRLALSGEHVSPPRPRSDPGRSVFLSAQIAPP